MENPITVTLDAKDWEQVIGVMSYYRTTKQGKDIYEKLTVQTGRR